MSFDIFMEQHPELRDEPLEEQQRQYGLYLEMIDTAIENG